MRFFHLVLALLRQQIVGLLHKNLVFATQENTLQTKA